MRIPLPAVLLPALALAGCLVDPSPSPPPATGSSFASIVTKRHGATEGSLITAHTDRQGTIWASGGTGSVLRRSGGGSDWVVETLPTDAIVTGLAEDDEGRMLAVAGSELLGRLDDGRWRATVIAPDVVLLELWRVPGGDLLAAGSRGTILRRVSGQWIPATVPASTEIWGIGGDSPADLVAVGQSGTVLESSDGGSTWQQVPAGTTGTLFAVASDGAGRFVAVGSGGEVLLRDGDAWERSASPTLFTLFEVRSSGSRSFLIAGDHGVLAAGDGLAWSPIPLPGQRENLRAMTGPPGSRVVVGWWGTILDEAQHWGAVETGTRLYALHVPPDGVPLAVGQGGAAFTRGAGGWTAVPVPAPATLLGVDGPSAHDRLAVGDSGTAVHFDGATWHVERTGVTGLLRDVWYDGLRALAVGADGVVLVREGGSWRTVPSGTTRYLRHIEGRSWGSLYVVGDSGTVLHWNGTRFSHEPVPTGQTLRAAWMWNPRDIYAVGDSGTIVHFNGRRWAAVPSPTHGVLRTAVGIDGVLYVAGEAGAAFKLEGGRWTALPSDQRGLWLAMDGHDGLIVVGEGAAIAEGIR